MQEPVELGAAAGSGEPGPREVEGGWLEFHVWPSLCTAHLVLSVVSSNCSPDRACLPVMQTPGGSKLSIDYSQHPPLLKVGSDFLGSLL